MYINNIRQDTSYFTNVILHDPQCSKKWKKYCNKNLLSEWLHDYHRNSTFFDIFICSEGPFEDTSLKKTSKKVELGLRVNCTFFQILQLCEMKKLISLMKILKLNLINIPGQFLKVFVLEKLLP